MLLLADCVPHLPLGVFSLIAFFVLMLAIIAVKVTWEAVSARLESHQGSEELDQAEVDLRRWLADRERP